MQGIACCAARDGASEFGDAYLDIFQAPGGRVFIGFPFIFVLKTEILGIRVIANLAAVLAVGVYVPPAGP